MEKTTTFKWFSVDAAGNVENNYDPANPATQDNYRSATINIGENLNVGATGAGDAQPVARRSRRRSRRWRRASVRTTRRRRRQT